MSQKENKITRRISNTYSFNFSNKNYIFCFYLLNNLKQLFKQKKIIITNEFINFANDELYLKSSLFFEQGKLRNYKKQKIENSLTKLSIINNKKILLENSIFKLFKHFNKKIKINNLSFNFEILNFKINKTLICLLYKKFKIIKFKLFKKRFSLFYDFLKLASLYISSKISMTVLLQNFSEILKFLHKNIHSKFISFLKFFFETLVNDLSIYKDISNKINGIKFIINGRLKGKPRSNTLCLVYGSVNTQSIDKNVEYSISKVFTQKFGTLGLKIWICR